MMTGLYSLKFVNCPISFKSNGQLCSKFNHHFLLCHRQLFLKIIHIRKSKKATSWRIQGSDDQILKLNLVCASNYSRTFTLEASMDFIPADQDKLLEGKDYEQDFEESLNPRHQMSNSQESHQGGDC
ncbi:unnamed protein product [Cuscuta europaea]|uniref:Uncharacterized protein n=1 Tax=Cuscuta europaea TaxID=41803 RepID=A0A9P0YTD7_CUSEU|nr:unnamed protein product [Cuscuta europaea]